MSSTRSKGSMGESIAEKYLKNKGYKILSKNVYTPFGELDIIAMQEKELVFVEVKSSFNIENESPLYNLNKKKYKHLYKSAVWYIKKHNEIKNYRIDCVGITILNNGEYNIDHIENIEI